MRAVVVGAGIGGLAATLSLRRAGCEVTLVEQTPRFTEVGAGIQLAPNATREMRRLDVLDAVAAQAARPPHVSFRTWSDGSEICRYALGREAEEEFGAPYLLLHRADLHGALAAAVPPESVRLNTTVVGIDQDDDSAHVTTATGERLTADVVVAADRIRSPARQWLFGKDEAVFSGTAAYRALLPSDEVADLDLPPLAAWLGPDRHFVHYWVRRGELLNVVAVFSTEATAQESWTAKAEPGERVGPPGPHGPRTRRPGLPLRHLHPHPAHPLEPRPSHPPRRQRPRDGPVPGPGRGPGHPGRGRTGRRPQGCDPGRRTRRARPLRPPPHLGRHEHAGRLGPGRQGLPLAGRPGGKGAQRPHGGVRGGAQVPAAGTGMEGGRLRSAVPTAIVPAMDRLLTGTPLRSTRRFSARSPQEEVPPTCGSTAPTCADLRHGGPPNTGWGLAPRMRDETSGFGGNGSGPAGRG